MLRQGVWQLKIVQGIFYFVACMTHLERPRLTASIAVFSCHSARIKHRQLSIWACTWQDLARYALICQDEGLVPIIEPDVSLKGDHDLDTAVAINVKIQSTLYKACLDHGVYIEGCILKSNIVNPGKSCPTPYTVEEIAKANIDTLKRCMPVAIRYATLHSPFVFGCR